LQCEKLSLDDAPIAAYRTRPVPAAAGLGYGCAGALRKFPGNIALREQHMKTFSQKPAEVEKKWIVVDAENVVLGRLASIVALRLRGKHKPTYTPHVDDGDNVIVVNADKVKLTGRKLQNKVYYWHTGYPGGIRQRTARNIIEGRFPERIVQKAVQRMMPEGPLARRQLKNLRVYAGSEHPHEAQQPEMLDVAAMNAKNSREAK
jgi:large subunit ribosomal protein L13